jgi:signal transduction histidine kinase/HAMP domain-containing protein
MRMFPWLHASGLRDISIRNKLLIAPAVLILALVLITSMAVYGLNTQADTLNQVDEITLEQIKLIDQFSLLSEQVQSDVYQIAVLRFMELPDEEIQPVQARLEQGINKLKIMYGEIATRWPLDESERSILEHMKIHMDDFTLQAQQAAESVTKNPSFGVLMVRSSTLSFTKFRETLTELLDYKREKISRLQAETIQKIDTLKTSILFFLFLVSLAGIITNLFISTRLIARPIQKTTHLMSRLADNDLSIEVSGLDHRDEIGAMARAVEVFRNNAIEKERLDKELHENQERLLLAQEVAHIGNWELDLASNTLWASVETFRIYGLERNSPYLPLAEAQKVPLREDRPRLDAALKALLQEQTPYNIEYRIMHSNEKTPRVIHSLANLVSDEIGTPTKVVGVIQDITARKQAEQKIKAYSEKLEEMVDDRTRELQNAQEQLVRQERLAMLGQMAGSVGHELRNPLAVITSALYYLKLIQPNADAKIKEYLGIIDQEVHTSEKIITDLLGFARIKSVDREAVSVSELIRQTLERYPAPPSVEVTLKITPGLPPVYADPQHILQVLGNLTVNACQSMTTGGKLTVSASAQDDMIVIAVQDSGEGIPPKNMSKLFEPLFTTKTKGIGLGLGVSRKLAEANGGRIEVQSEPGKGSTFTLVLPVYEEPAK